MLTQHLHRASVLQHSPLSQTNMDHSTAAVKLEIVRNNRKCSRLCSWLVKAEKSCFPYSRWPVKAKMVII